MRIVETGLWIAAGIQFGLLAANLYIPKRMRYREGIAAAPPIIRQVFYAHAIYIAGVIAIFAALTLGFARELASGTGLGRFLSIALCVFWFSRVPLQLLYFDKKVRRENRLGDVAMIAALIFLGVAYGAAAIGPVR